MNQFVNILLNNDSNSFEFLIPIIFIAIYIVGGILKMKNQSQDADASDDSGKGKPFKKRGNKRTVRGYKSRTKYVDEEDEVITINYDPEFIEKLKSRKDRSQDQAAAKQSVGSGIGQKKPGNRSRSERSMQQKDAPTTRKESFIDLYNSRQISGLTEQRSKRSSTKKHQKRGHPSGKRKKNNVTQSLRSDLVNIENAEKLDQTTSFMDAILKDKDSLKKAIIASEILNKPIALRE